MPFDDEAVKRECRMSQQGGRGFSALALGLAVALCIAPSCRSQELTNSNLAVKVQDGTFQVALRTTANRPVLSARSRAEIDYAWVRSSDYPHHHAAVSTFHDALGTGSQIRVICSGLQDKPDPLTRLSFMINTPMRPFRSKYRTTREKRSRCRPSATGSRPGVLLPDSNRTQLVGLEHKMNRSRNMLMMSKP